MSCLRLVPPRAAQRDLRAYTEARSLSREISLKIFFDLDTMKYFSRSFSVMMMSVMLWRWCQLSRLAISETKLSSWKLVISFWPTRCRISFSENRFISPGVIEFTLGRCLGLCRVARDMIVSAVRMYSDAPGAP